jgi:hypothetical protein
MEPPLPSPTKTWHNKAYAAISPDKPELSAKNKVVVVTGGGSGIGVGLVEGFAKAGAAYICILGRTEATLQKTKQDIERKYKSKVLFAVADVVDEAAIRQAFENFHKQAGKIDVLVHNAGYMSDLLIVQDSKLDEWWKSFEVRVDFDPLVRTMLMMILDQRQRIVCGDQRIFACRSRQCRLDRCQHRRSIPCRAKDHGLPGVQIRCRTPLRIRPGRESQYPSPQHPPRRNRDADGSQNKRSRNGLSFG